MASTYSTSLRLELMATGDQSGTWGDTTNTNLGTLLEQAITGVLSVAQGDATLTLTALDGATDQSRNAVVNLTGAMTGAQNVVVPNANKLYLIKNSTSGGFAVTVKTSAGTGVTVPAGTARWVYADGTDVVDGLSGPWTPSTNSGAALGTVEVAWSSLFIESASSGVLATLTSTEAGATAGPVLELYRNSTSPAINDVLGRVLFNGEDSAGNTQEYASIEALIIDATSASEDGALDAYVPIAGSRTRVLSLGPNMSVPVNTNNVTTAPGIAFLGDANTGFGSSGADTLDFVNGGVNTARIASTGARSTVIPGGSTLLPAFDCRAWVNFEGTGTVAIRASGNVSSITDNNVGNYTVNFTTAMPDIDYATLCSTGSGGLRAFNAPSGTPTASSVTINTGTLQNTLSDMTYVNVAIFR